MAKKLLKDPKDVRRGRGYWDWCDRHQPTDELGRIIEPYGANTDQFNAEKHEPEQCDELKAIIQVLNEGGLDTLTIRQKRAFKLVMLQGMSYRQAATRMGIGWTSVEDHVKAAAKKLRKLCEDKI